MLLKKDIFGIIIVSHRSRSYCPRCRQLRLSGTSVRRTGRLSGKTCLPARNLRKYMLIKIKFTILNFVTELQAPQPYSFAWEVNDAPSYNNYAHSESSDGKVVTGSYRVALPDGRTQIVTYKADSYGYVADVKYEGEAKYPEYVEKKEYKSYTTPAYKAPAYTAPAYKAPAYIAPVYKTPAYTAPAPAAPAYTAPAPAAPAYAAPAPAAPAYTAPAPAAPAYSTPVPAAPVYTAPAPAAPVYTAPAKY